MFLPSSKTGPEPHLRARMRGFLGNSVAERGWLLPGGEARQGRRSEEPERGHGGELYGLFKLGEEV